MENGNDENVIKQFDKIAFLPDKWDHNQQYQHYLLKHIPKNCNTILDVGCGTGELTKKLVSYSKEIIGIDISENMIHEAKKRNNDEKITYLKVSVEKYFEEADKTFDIIISIAALHHMDEEKILQMMKNKLTRNGKIVILDLVKSETIGDWLLSILAALLNPWIMLIMRRRIRVTKEERKAWDGHFRYDNYLTIREAKKIARHVLGKSKVKRHLFWRYSILYNNGG
ncbi:MAG: class I SAM-dependent methyltransferase [Treponema sp.]|jgi:2-polyprenyl-3-methyl-5-hydroxy-6-metoxy-1,4-benzoquinol methylase|nr:class I SAM-dependent methyltransferase [Treponema sp.]